MRLTTIPPADLLRAAPFIQRLRMRALILLDRLSFEAWRLEAAALACDGLASDSEAAPLKRAHDKAARDGVAVVVIYREGAR